ncbi:hypothetical protein BT96DRAFT_987631 [Gymnopus androsaceus JB14]|uniref:Uncharacterized protein n=1 Tax=Gymnopus androsaceus JB14 TaxID=1447944 RepID=A0A6A4I3R9_9AGAR|nr:hypothetical protein BT96DRAFT_987631 [Gymnopus androsaceus JB14]
MSSACPPNTTSQILVDDTDPRIIYSDGWSGAGTVGNECDGTTHDSNFIPGATASFSFEGTGIEVYGTVPATIFTPTASFQVDNQNSTFSFPGDNAVHYRTIYYTSPSLTAGNHTLSMTVTSNSSTKLYLDYLVYSPILSTSSTIPQSAASTTVTSTTSTGLAVGDSSSQSHPASRVGAIIGGIFGGIVVGIALGILLMCILLRRSRKIQSLFHYKSENITQFTSLAPDAAFMVASPTDSNATTSG